MSFQRDKLVRAVVADDVRQLQVCFQRDPRWLHTKFAHPDGWKWSKLPGWRGKKSFYLDDKSAWASLLCSVAGGAGTVRCGVRHTASGLLVPECAPARLTAREAASGMLA